MCEFAIPGAITVLWTLSLKCCVLSLPSLVASDIIYRTFRWKYNRLLAEVNIGSKWP